jgi:hypothetical protein
MPECQATQTFIDAADGEPLVVACQRHAVWHRWLGRHHAIRERADLTQIFKWHRPGRRGNPAPLAIAAVAVAWLAAATWAILSPEPAWYQYHHSYNEHWYSGILRGGIHESRLPPGYPWLAGTLPFEPIVALRMVSLAAGLGFIGVVGATRGLRPAALVASLPWVIIWSSRAQTDMLMTALAWGGLLLALAIPRLGFFGGLLTGLSTFVKPPGLLAATTWGWKFLAGVVLGCLPVAWWLGAGGAASLGFHAGHGTPLGNVFGNAFGLALGAGFTMLLLARRHFTNQVNRPLVFATALFLLFALVKAPIAHQYYMLPALVGFGLLADTNHPWFWWIVAVNATIGLSMVLWLSTKLGTNLFLEFALAVLFAAGLVVVSMVRPATTPIAARREAAP